MTRWRPKKRPPAPCIWCGIVTGNQIRHVRRGRCRSWPRPLATEVKS